jgi:imidazolonepropionase-like amidohydrolase
MNRTFLAMGLAIMVLAGSCSEPSPSPTLASPDLVWTNVTVVDVLSGERQTDMTVLIQGDRITQIGRGIALPDQAVQIDGSGKFLIPGLWDAHPSADAF